ncbi:hypothetical protein BC829DRAFT_448722 [Chytridium lagenaria]|nr:hypothetical protein BC829DRAFT_448722 [Chytridium lagenaria]
MTSIPQLYRSFLKRLIKKLASRLPTPERRSLIRRRVIHDFRQPLESDEALDFRVRLAESQLENLKVQVDHLTELAARPKGELLIPVDIYRKDGAVSFGRFGTFVKGEKRRR